jgi:mannose-1-phosphate guanylyltransferase
MPRLWAVVLAGGEGARLREVTTALTGEPTPKQFCRLLGGKTLLEETTGRLAGMVDDRRTLLLLSASHRRFYADLAQSRQPALLAEQPGNLGTAVGMAFALGRIRQTDRDAVVGFFPSDHHYADVTAFREAVSTAYRVAASHRDRLALVAATPHGPERDYGWIEPGPTLNEDDEGSPVYTVTRFWEKPDGGIVHRLFQNQCFWNTFVTVGSVGAFHSAFVSAQPALADALDAVAAAGSAAEEAQVVHDVYARLPRLCFSADVLARAAERCVAVPLHSSGWIDIGRPERLAGVRRPDTLSA